MLLCPFLRNESLSLFESDSNAFYLVFATAVSLRFVFNKRLSREGVEYNLYSSSLTSVASITAFFNKFALFFFFKFTKVVFFIKFIKINFSNLFLKWKPLFKRLSYFGFFKNGRSKFFKS
jgi:hypothetical protein